MQFKNFAVAALAGTAAAQASSNMSICDKYTTALLMTNNATTQYTVLTLLVNTVVIGNYTSNPGSLNAVPGILAPGTYMGQNVSLLPYFSGALASSNRNNQGRAVNFLDDGGAAPLKMNKPANGTSSNQYRLLTHLYQYFGALLGCSGYGQMGFPSYGGVLSQYQVHKFMGLNKAQIGYFIEQVGLAATSFGVTMEDATAVGGILDKAFNYACIPAAGLVSNMSVLNSMCTASTCPQASPSNCSAYDTSNSNGTTSNRPSPANSTNNGTGTGTGSGSGTSGTSTPGAAALLVVPGTGFLALFLAFFAL